MWRATSMKKDRVKRLLYRIGGFVTCFFISKLAFGPTRVSGTAFIVGIVMILFIEFSRDEE